MTLTRTPIVDRNHDTPGPGTKKNPKRKIIKRWMQGNHDFAQLECGHTVRATKAIDFKEGVGVRCSLC